MQRASDFLFALVAILITAPILAVSILAIVVFDFGPPFYRHRRVGRYGREFHLIKLRTMKRGATGVNLTVAGDSRVSTIGRLLRRFKLDELPQLFNVLFGQMGVVGPRPESPDFVAQYTDEQRQIFDYRPGLTDPASLKYRHEERLLAQYSDPIQAYSRLVMPDKVALSLEYQKRRSLKSDFNIILQTIAAIFR